MCDPAHAVVVNDGTCGQPSTVRPVPTKILILNRCECVNNIKINMFQDRDQDFSKTSKNKNKTLKIGTLRLPRPRFTTLQTAREKSNVTFCQTFLSHWCQSFAIFCWQMIFWSADHNSISSSYFEAQSNLQATLHHPAVNSNSFLASDIYWQKHQQHIMNALGTQKSRNCCHRPAQADTEILLQLNMTIVNYFQLELQRVHVKKQHYTSDHYYTTIILCSLQLLEISATIHCSHWHLKCFRMLTAETSKLCCW